MHIVHEIGRVLNENPTMQVSLHGHVNFGQGSSVAKRLSAVRGRSHACGMMAPLVCNAFSVHVRVWVRVGTLRPPRSPHRSAPDR